LADARKRQSQWCLKICLLLNNCGHDGSPLVKCLAFGPPVLPST
jgi:hypothetical protein